MTPGFDWLRWALCVSCFTAALVVFAATLANPESLPFRSYSLYVARLDRTLYNLLLPKRGRWIVVGQALALEVVGLACIGYGAPWHYLGLVPLLLGPRLYLEQLRKRRLAAIEAQVDTFLLTLANALRATPSIPRALGYTEELLQEPMRSELGIALQELRLGNTIDQALLTLGARVKSPTLDAALLAVLIGGQVGGELTKVLETTAATLREMTRLQGILRSKTAEAKSQMLIMALFPVLVVYGFSRTMPGFFEPLLTTSVGHVLVGVAALLWLSSLFVARRLLAVEL